MAGSIQMAMAGLKWGSPEELRDNIVLNGYRLEIDLAKGFYVVEIGLAGFSKFIVNDKPTKGSGKVFSKQMISAGKIIIKKDPAFSGECKLEYLKVFTPMVEVVDKKPKTYIFKYD